MTNRLQTAVSDSMAGNRRHIPEAQKELLVTMSHRIKSSEIARVTQTGHRTMNRILRLHRDTGSVVKKLDVIGRPRLLNAIDVSVSCFLSLSSSKIFHLTNCTSCSILNHASNELLTYT